MMKVRLALIARSLTVCVVEDADTATGQHEAAGLQVGVRRAGRVVDVGALARQHPARGAEFGGAAVRAVPRRQRGHA
jgi:hypothetical protein